jgi:hypothetical protein
VNGQLCKELRCTLPAAIAAFGIPAGVQLCLGRTHYTSNDGIPLFALCTALLGASPFGSEYAHGTLPFLLAQPVRRTSIWIQKTAILASLLAGVTALFILCTYQPARQMPLLLLPPIAALGLTPWLTLVFRDGLIGAALTVMFEWVVLLLAMQLFRWRLLLPSEREFSGSRYAAAAIAVCLCSAAGWVAGRWTLQHWQAVPRRRGFGWHIRFSMTSAARQRTIRSPYVSLFLKELHLHRINLVLMACFAAIFGPVLWHYDQANDFLQGLNKFYSFIFPVSVGAVTIARERQLAVLETQALLPLSVFRQWSIKTFTCFALSLCGGIFVPWALLKLHAASHAGIHHDWFKVFDYTTETLIAAALALLASSVTRGTLGAVILALGLSFASLIYCGAIIAVLHGSEIGHDLVQLVGHASPLALNAYPLSAIAFAGPVLIVRPTISRLRYPTGATNLKFLALQTLILITLVRLAFLFLPLVRH